MLPLLGGLISAWHGGRIIGGSPKVLKAFVWAAPFAYLVWIASGELYLTALCLILCWMGKNTGHGRGFNLSKPFEAGTTPERVEILIPRISVYWHKVWIMALTGLTAVSGAVLAFLFINPLYALLIAVGGLFKGINAIIFDEHTEAREFADGVAAYSPILTIISVFP